MIESDIEHYKGEGNSWMYHRFISISKLEPKFYKNYHIGGRYLSIIKDDVKGAAELYEIGLKHYPADYWLLYNAGFNATFELGDLSKGLLYYSQIKNHPTTIKNFPFITSLVERLRVNLGAISLTDAFLALESQLNATKEERIIEGLKKHLYAIKAQIDLECLNAGEKACDKTDYKSLPYIKKEGEWKATRPWKTFKFQRD